MGSPVWLMAGLVAIPALIAANALFVAAEFALVSVRRTRVKELVAQGVRGSRRLDAAVAELDRYIAATQLGITLASIGLGWLGEPALARLVLPALGVFGPVLSGIAAHSIAFTVSFALISFLHVVLGELAPKTVALQVPDRVGLWVVRPLMLFERVFRPFIWMLNHAGAMVVRLLGFSVSEGVSGQVHSVKELGLLVEASERAGVLERQEKEMMQGVLAFGDLIVGQVMTRRGSIVSVRESDDLEKILQVAIENGYSRLPVTGSGPDDIVGVVHTKDLLHLFAEGEKGLVVLQDVIRQPQFVRAGTRVLDLLRDFQRGEQHVAFVLDDFGELAGLVTIEDLLEEIVGEIRDEFDLSERALRLDAEGNRLASGRVEARMCLHALGVPSPASAGGSLGEFLRGLAGRPLAAGTRVPYAGLTFIVLEAGPEGVPARVRIEKTDRPA